MKNSLPSVVRFGPCSFVWRPRVALIGAGLVLLAVLVAVVLLGIGTLHLSPGEVLASLFGMGDNPTAERIIQRVRLPRVLTAVLVGAALGMAGSVFQSISRNALGSPDIIGFTTGAASGAIVQIILFNAGPLGTSLAAVLSGVCTAAVVFFLSLKGRTTGGYRLVLVGIGVGAILTGLNTVLLVTGDLDQAMTAQLWLSGSLNTRTWSHVVPAALGFVLIVPIALYHARHLNLLEMGDDTARQLGVSVERARLVMVMAAVGLTSVATAAAGPISFIALAAPQLARRLTGSPDIPLVTGAAMGALLLLSADLVSQRFPLNLNLPIGLTTGLLGGFYLLWLLTRSRKPIV
ncbi:iron chelate uptake ABC transporter family permease subunit [Pseudomonas sp. 7P_10.2_Bac1]|uniref:FecCD family ABC transporter permease n=1 Tax=Pseudomonas sp. 7P_10.2_Bac1 TaxID=2971614 RepID=UPI0021CA8AA8|nr:iron chelate uptake ABC transporter family permease subunit [Pseudomonas sp. 7P_10.2_Bac1]MCU1726685.1 iron chelate uptake ABC transporter family permease subunit [Pseudomonas sp. 7P_10.2_Bac1]